MIPNILPYTFDSGKFHLLLPAGTPCLSVEEIRDCRQVETKKIFFAQSSSAVRSILGYGRENSTIMRTNGIVRSNALCHPPGNACGIKKHGDLVILLLRSCVRYEHFGSCFFQKSVAWYPPSVDSVTSCVTSFFSSSDRGGNALPSSMSKLSVSCCSSPAWISVGPSHQ